jgi:hypothetical protein
LCGACQTSRFDCNGVEGCGVDELEGRNSCTRLRACNKRQQDRYGRTTASGFQLTICPHPPFVRTDPSHFVALHTKPSTDSSHDSQLLSARLLRARNCHAPLTAYPDPLHRPSRVQPRFTRETANIPPIVGCGVASRSGQACLTITSLRLNKSGVRRGRSWMAGAGEPTSQVRRR